MTTVFEEFMTNLSGNGGEPSTWMPTVCGMSVTRIPHGWVVLSQKKEPYWTCSLCAGVSEVIGVAPGMSGSYSVSIETTVSPEIVWPYCHWRGLFVLSHCSPSGCTHFGGGGTIEAHVGFDVTWSPEASEQ